MKGLLRGALALCTIVCANASAREWAVIDGLVTGRADPNRYSVVVMAVDGQADFEAPTYKKIKPGFHYVQLAPTKQDMRGPQYVPYGFMAEPCTRYAVYAEFESQLPRSPWQLVIEKDPKPLGGCTVETHATSPASVAASAAVPKPEGTGAPAPADAASSATAPNDAGVAPSPGTP